MPATRRSRAASTSATHDSGCFPCPTSASVPTMLRTMLYKKSVGFDFDVNQVVRRAFRNGETSKSKIVRSVVSRSEPLV